MTILQKPASAAGTWNQYIWSVVNNEPDEDFENPAPGPESIRIITPQDIINIKNELLKPNRLNGGLKGIAKKFNVPIAGVKRVYMAVKKKKSIVNK